MAQNITVLIPSALRPQTENQSCVELPGDSVMQVLTALTRQYPELGKRLFKADNELNRFVNVYVNDEDIRFMDNLQTAVKAGDELSIVPAIAGG